MRWHQNCPILFDFLSERTFVCRRGSVRIISNAFPFSWRIIVWRTHFVRNQFQTNTKYVVNCVISVTAGGPYYLEIWFHFSVTHLNAKMDSWHRWVNIEIEYWIADNSLECRLNHDTPVASTPKPTAHIVHIEICWFYRQLNTEWTAYLQ